MKQPDLLSDYPMRRIKAIDGTAVTAQLWEEAHGYHRAEMRLHRRYAHCAGILEGLEVVAAEPADATVYVRPGVAVDALGRRIVVPEPMTYHLGASEGRLSLVLSYVESQAGRGTDQEDGPLYIHAQYSLDAVQGEVEEEGFVALAMFERHGQSAALRNAQDPEMPGINEIDLRFRAVPVQTIVEPALVGGYALGGKEAAACAAGVRELARGLRAMGRSVWADRVLQLDSQLDRYDVLILLASEAFELTAEQMSALYRYLQGGGSMVLLSSAQDQVKEAPVQEAVPPAEGKPEGEPQISIPASKLAVSEADASIKNLMDSLAVQLEPLAADDELLRQPYLFAELPMVNGDALSGDGVLSCSAPWIALWAAKEVSGAKPGRADIRSAHELGANLLAAAARRRASKGDRTE